MMGLFFMGTPCKFWELSHKDAWNNSPKCQILATGKDISVLLKYDA